MKELIFISENVNDTNKLANLIASLMAKGDLILLKGELGAGKTTLARGIINSKYFANDDEHVVPSPTFSLIQTYEFNGHLIGHADLYRVENPEEIIALELQNIVEEGSLIIEWPDMVETSISANTLKIYFKLYKDKLNIVINDGGGWKDRIRSISFK
tara:strand:- start:14959 stop:15429 length:471 start_codon:yes stop_codon:yes gene_type:complete